MFDDPTTEVSPAGLAYARCYNCAYWRTVRQKGVCTRLPPTVLHNPRRLIYEPAGEDNWCDLHEMEDFR